MKLSIALLAAPALAFTAPRHASTSVARYAMDSAAVDAKIDALAAEAKGIFDAKVDSAAAPVAGVKSADGAAAESTLASKIPFASAARASILASTAALSMADRATFDTACLGAVKARAGAASKAMESFIFVAARGVGVTALQYDAASRVHRSLISLGCSLAA